MSICNGANLPALFQAIKYLFKLDKKAQKQHLATPRLLRRACALLFYLLVLSYIISAADAWFHATSTAVVVQSSAGSVHSDLAINFGRQINYTQCEEAMNSVGPIFQATCGLTDSTGASNGPLAEGARTVSNSSSLNRVVFTNDQTAIIVPNSIPPNITYTAQTVGLRASCERFVPVCYWR